MAFPVPYQVDFISETKGRHLDSTKRKLTWKFGFAHPPAVFPHLRGGDDDDDDDDDGRGAPKGVECRGREHEVMVTWSILTSKVHIYVDSKEIYRHSPYHNESILYTFNGEMHRGFDLPSPEFNGRHRVDLRLYARTPLGAKNMVVDENGGRFRQFDLAVDGLSYFSMPHVFELGMPDMWEKVSRWGAARLESSRREAEDRLRHGGEEEGRRGRYEDGTGRTFSEDGHPQTESEEVRMMRIATEASLQDWDKRVGYGKNSKREIRSNDNEDTRPSGKGNGQKSGSRRTKKGNVANNLTAIGEDNLIDFGVEEAANSVFQIHIPERNCSDVSAMDDDATTASFMMNTAMPAQQPPSTGQLYCGHQQHPSPFSGPDPTFHGQYVPRPWPGDPPNPRHRYGGVPPSDVSFAVPPAPTLDDYEDAFGGSTMHVGAYMAGGPAVALPPASPASSASVGMGSPMAQHRASHQHGMQQASQQYGMMQASQQYGTMQASAPMAPQQQWQSRSSGAPDDGGGGVAVGGSGKGHAFDPFRADPFAS